MKLFRRVLGVVLTVALLIGLFVTWQHRQDIYDWWRLRGYSPPSSVVELADETTMSPEARRIFYVNRPDIANSTSFNAACSQEATIVLGCYISNKGIYIYHITDKRLDGVQQVTAAHEMLHAAYERLSDQERAHIDELTAAAYARVTSKRVRQTVSQYKAQDPSVVPNELHSILGTEVKDVGTELEAYYKQYFNNRQAIVDFSEQYEKEFESRTNQVSAYDNQLKSLKVQIDASRADLDQQYKELISEKQRLDSLLASGDVRAYNAAVPAFNRQVYSYNATVRSTDALINDYNATVKKRNAVASEIASLAKAIDSRPQSF